MRRCAFDCYLLLMSETHAWLNFLVILNLATFKNAIFIAIFEHFGVFVGKSSKMENIDHNYCKTSSEKYSCKFPGCDSAYMCPCADQNIRFFKFPQDYRNPLWKSVCGIDFFAKTDNLRICEKHFSSEDFVGGPRAKRFKLNNKSVPKTIVEATVENSNLSDSLSLVCNTASLNCEVPFDYSVLLRHPNMFEVQKVPKNIFSGTLALRE